MRWLYTLLLYLLSPIILLRLFLRARRAPAYRERIAERFGFFAPTIQPGGIWVHVVSVGETIAAAPMVRVLRERYPDLTITLTTMTPTGSERVRALFAADIASGHVVHVYAPYDLPGAVGRFLRRVRPRLLIVVETELWPNWIHACARRRIPVLLANGRLSERSARGYQRLRGITRPMLRAMTRVVVQNAMDGERFVALGLPREKLCVSGSVKFDLTIDAELEARAEALRASFGARPVWIAASTHAGEDDILLAAHQRVLQHSPQALLILVPRHPERFDEVAALIGRVGLTQQRRSLGETLAASTQVLLGDTMGELLLLLGAADVVFVGGSLIERGGHNTLEPAAWGLPILTGPSDFNFREISTLLQKAGAQQVVEADADRIAEAVLALLANPAERERRGVAAMVVVENNRGALDRLTTEIGRVLQSVARRPLSD